MYATHQLTALFAHIDQLASRANTVGDTAVVGNGELQALIGEAARLRALNQVAHVGMHHLRHGPDVGYVFLAPAGVDVTEDDLLDATIRPVSFEDGESTSLSEVDADAIRIFPLTAAA